MTKNMIIVIHQCISASLQHWYNSAKKANQQNLLAICSVCKVYFSVSYIIYLSVQCISGSWLLEQHGRLVDSIRVLGPFIAIIQFHRRWNVTSGNEDWSCNCPYHGINKDRRFNDCKTLRSTWWTFRRGKAMAVLVEKFLGLCRQQRPTHRSG